MFNVVKNYRDRLEEGITEYMKTTINERSATAVCAMLKCLNMVDEFLDDCYEEPFTIYEHDSWMHKLQNEDGTDGAHWSVTETNAIPHAYSDVCWNATMNMMYSDYCGVARSHNVDNVDFYADMSRAFLDDKDAGDNKLAKYYRSIVAK